MELAAAAPRSDADAAWNKAVALILLTGLVAYCNTFTKGFLLDDYGWIVNGMLPDLGDYVARQPNRWVVMIATWVNFQLAQFNPIGYHGLNLAAHLAAALALFGVVRRTLLLGGTVGGSRPWPERYTQSATGFALAVALLWVAHPMLTHAVTYIIQRCESMMGMFWLLTVYCVLRGATAERRGWLWYLAGIACAALGAGCKESMGTAPLAVLAFDWVFLSKSFRELVRKRWWVHLGIAAAVWGFVVFMQRAILLEASTGSAGFSSRTLPWQHYLMTQGWMILRYLYLTFWPIDLCFEYRDWQPTTTFEEFWPAGLALGSAFLVSLYGTLRRRWWGFVGLWFFLALAVSSSVVPILDPGNEYRTYLAVISPVIFTTAAAAGLLRLVGARARPAAAGALLGVAVAFLVGRTLVRNEDYNSMYTMWTDLLEKRPGTSKVFNDVGVGAVNEGKFDEAEKYYREGLKHGSFLPLLHNNLGQLLWSRGKGDEALEHVRRAVQIDGNYALAQGNLGRFLLIRGDPAAAVPHLRKQVDTSPEAWGFRAYLYLALHELGRREEAERERSEVLRIAPGAATGSRQNGWHYLLDDKNQGEDRFREALVHARIANLLSGGKDPDILDLLAAAHAAQADRAAKGAYSAHVGEYHFRQAVAVAEDALRLARAANRAELVRVLDRRLRLYRDGRSLVQTAARPAAPSRSPGS
jgi:protein O-mannosyl-transferase